MIFFANFESFECELNAKLTAPGREVKQGAQFNGQLAI